MHKNLSRNEIIKLLKAEKTFLKENFGVIHIGIFGSCTKPLRGSFLSHV